MAHNQITLAFASTCIAVSKNPKDNYNFFVLIIRLARPIELILELKVCQWGFPKTQQSHQRSC